MALASIAEGAPPQQGSVPPTPSAPAFRLDTGSRLDQLYIQWKDECKKVQFSSKTEDYNNLPAFRAIVALGWWGLPQLRQMVEETGDSMLALAVDEICGCRRQGTAGLSGANMPDGPVMSHHIGTPKSGHMELRTSDQRVERAVPPIAGAIRARLPARWECALEWGSETKFVPHGLANPAFVVVSRNPNVPFPSLRGQQNPVIPLCFYPIAGKATIMKTIEREKLYSWSIPVYFGETDEFIVVTSPAFVNGGVFAPEARRALKPMWTVLRELIPLKEDSQIDELQDDRER